MKKVGIATYYSIYNYGSVMQAYALFNTIKELGYQPILIDHANMNKAWNRRVKYKVIRDRAFQLLMHSTYIVNTIKIKRSGKKDIVIRSLDQDRKFDQFLRDHFIFPETDYTKDENYVAFVSGSDQVWQFSIPGLHYLFFLRFCNKEKRIAYAASFGAISVPKYNEKLLRKYLNEFAHISVRECVGIEIVERYSSNSAIQVLDPVLLVKREFWEQFKIDYSIDTNYLIAYFLSNPESYLDNIREYATNKGLKVIWISTGYEIPIEGENVLEPSPREFLGLISESTFVCTDSLHGTEFAIAFHKQFITFPRHYKIVPEQHSRITSLLKMTKTENRLYDGNTSSWGDLVDFCLVDSEIDSLRDKSINFLDTSLSEAIIRRKK